MMEGKKEKMASYNVEYEGKWACFTSVADGFVTEFMEKDEYENWRKQEYGKENYEPAEQCNLMTMERAVAWVRLNRTHKKALDNLVESTGLSQEVCQQLLYNLEKKSYCPIPNQNYTYNCPNCFAIVEKYQLACRAESCKLEFVWFS